MRTRLATLLVLLLTAGAPRAEVIDRVLAIVDGTLVTLSDVRAAVVLQLVAVPDRGDPLEAGLERWIDRLLVLQEVERFAPPEPDPAVVNVRLADVLSRLGPPEVRRRQLEALGVSEAWLRDWVRDDLRIQAYIDQRFSGSLEPTDEELENYARENPGAFGGEGQLTPADEQAIARTGAMAARQRALVADWVDGLRRRAEILRPSR
ncbi:MAG TPA: hypothetical protein VIL20_18435 [Sandaracinaceae bacterium]